MQTRIKQTPHELSDPLRDFLTNNPKNKLIVNMSAANVKLSDIPSYPCKLFLSIAERFRKRQKVIPLYPF